MTRSKELQQTLAFKGTRQRPKRKTHRRFWIAAAVIHVGFAAIDRKMHDRRGAAEHLAEAAYCRAVARAYPRTLAMPRPGAPR